MSRGKFLVCSSFEMKRLLLLFIIWQSALSSCPPGWELVSAGQCRGYVTTMDLYFDERAVNTVSKQCDALNAYDVSIHNSEQQAYWKARGWLIIGLGCFSGEKTWRWTDGSSLDYYPPSYDSALTKNCKGGCTWWIDVDGTWQITCDSLHSYTSKIYCVQTLVPPKPSGDGCESFEDDSGDGICYQIGKTAENFLDAQKICRSFNADLASIHNSNENSFVRRTAVSKGAVNGMFLGGKVPDKGKPFAWTDGSKWDYDNFYPGFPMTGLGDCLAMDTSGTTGEWVNVDCSSKQAVACERKQHYTTPACLSGPWNEGDLIYSPGFPVSASTPCDYILSVDAGKKVQVEIFLLEANSCCDHLILNDNYIGGTVIANLTGEINDKTYKTTTSNFMRVSWQPNGGKNVRGVMFTFRAV